MKRTRHLRLSETEIEGIITPNQEENPIQGEAETMDTRNGSLKLPCLRKRSGTRIGSCQSLIIWLSLVQTMKSWMACKRNIGI